MGDGSPSSKVNSAAIRLFRFFASLRLTLPLLFGLALGAVAGTIIPQNLPEADYARLYPPALAAILTRLHLFDLFHSWWFLALLGLLAVNLVLCSWQRLPGVWCSLRNIPAVPSPSCSGRRFSRSFTLPEGDIEVAGEAISAFLVRRFAPPRRCLVNGILVLAAQRGVWTRLAVFLIHGAILMVLAGGMAGLLWGFQGYAVVPEGETVYELLPRRGNRPLPLGFGLRCDNFSVSFYGDGRPKEFRSLVSILKQDEVVLERQPITVNAPLSFDGLRFYQSDYGPAGPPKVTLWLQPPPPGAPFRTTLSPGETTPLPQGGKLLLVRFTPAFRDLGPAALVEVAGPGGESYSLPVFQNRPDLGETHSSGRGLRLNLESFEQPYYTVLLATHDPGVGLVWTGFLLLATGLTASLLFSQRRIWVSIAPEHGLSVVTVTGEWRRNSFAAAAFFRTLAERMEQEMRTGR
jgi:cytochrome c biogenesis protein